MSELSIDELQAETGELLPERETLGSVVISNTGVADAYQTTSFLSVNKAVLVQENTVYGSFNHTHI
jgi:hypothetical protein